VGPLGGDARDPEALTTNAKKEKMLTIGPLGGGVGNLGAPTINAENVDDGPLGGVIGDPGASTINTKNVDDAPPGRGYQRSESVHHQCKKRRRRGPWEAVLEVQECPPSTQKTSTVGPCGEIRSVFGIQKVCCKPVWVA
jgi:hypothetical protein